MKIIIALLCFSLIGCKNYWYRKNNTFKHIIKSEYRKNEIIHISNSIVCERVKTITKIDKIHLNQDSVFNIFSNSLTKLDLKLIKSQGESICDSVFFNNRLLRFRKFDLKRIEKLANFKSRDLVLVPIIYIDNPVLRNIYFTSHGAVGGGGFSKSTNLGVAVFLFRDKHLIYYKSMHFIADGVDVNDKYEKVSNITQENWDKLVELLMQDYIKRMK